MKTESKQDDLRPFRMYFGLTLLQLMISLFGVGVVGAVIVNYFF